MSQENVEVVERAVAALNARDLDSYLACCTQDVELVTPLASIGAVYEGPEGIRQFLADIEDTGPDFHLELQRAETVGTDRVLAYMRVSSRGRASGIATDGDSANVYDLLAGKIKRIRIFLDRAEALRAVGLSD
jgi:hypothetical protein